MRGQRQLAARDQIELARLAPDFQHHRADRVAGQCIRCAAQRRVDVRCAHADHKARIEAEFGEPAHRQRTRFNLAKILAHPDQRTARAQPSRKARDQSCGRPALPSLGKHLVHRAGGQAAAQRRIGARMAERDAIERMRLAWCLQPFDAAAQGRKHVRACAHAPLPLEMMAVPVSERRTRSWLICS